MELIFFTGGGIISQKTPQISISNASLSMYDQYSGDIFTTNVPGLGHDPLTIDTPEYSDTYSHNIPHSPSTLMHNLTLNSPGDFTQDRLSPYPAYNYDQQHYQFSEQHNSLSSSYGSVSPSRFDYLSDDCDLNSSFAASDLTELTEEDMNALEMPNFGLASDWDTSNPDSHFQGSVAPSSDLLMPGNTSLDHCPRTSLTPSPDIASGRSK